MTHPSKNPLRRLPDHQTFFVRQPDTGLTRAHCTCGWHGEFADATEAQTMAAVHDINEEFET